MDSDDSGEIFYFSDYADIYTKTYGKYLSEKDRNEISFKDINDEIVRMIREKNESKAAIQSETASQSE